MTRDYDILYTIRFKGVYPGEYSGYHVSIDGGNPILYKRFSIVLEDLSALAEYRIKVQHEWLTDKEVGMLESIDGLIVKEFNQWEDKE